MKITGGDSVAASTANTHSPSLMSAHQNEIDSVPVVEVTANRRKKTLWDQHISPQLYIFTRGTLCTPIVGECASGVPIHIYMHSTPFNKSEFRYLQFDRKGRQVLPP